MAELGTPNPVALPDESQLEAMYEAWVDSGAHLDEGDRYGHERAAFYAGVAARQAWLARDVAATAESETRS